MIHDFVDFVQPGLICLSRRLSYNHGMDHLWAPWRMTYLCNGGTPETGCIFCQKVQVADVEEHILYRGDTCYVVLNRYPYSNGHLMVVPYCHVPTLEALDDPTALELMTLVRRSLHALRQVYNPQGFNLGVNEGAVAGAGVAGHVHLHIVPRWGGDTNYMTVVGETRVIPETLETTYTRLRPLFDALR